jgi:hypothetical protein
VPRTTLPASQPAIRPTSSQMMMSMMPSNPSLGVGPA